MVKIAYPCPFPLYFGLSLISVLNAITRLEVTYFCMNLAYDITLSRLPLSFIPRDWSQSLDLPLAILDQTHRGSLELSHFYSHGFERGTLTFEIQIKYDQLLPLAIVSRPSTHLCWFVHYIVVFIHLKSSKNAMTSRSYQNSIYIKSVIAALPKH